MKKPETISAELLAAYLEGNATAEENRRILLALENNRELREMIKLSREIDDELNLCAENQECIPFVAKAASCGEENYCCLECEKFILTKHGVGFDEDDLLATALRNRWQEEKGTSLNNIGRHLESHGFTVTRRYQGSALDMASAIAEGMDVIAVVDGGELLGDRDAEHFEDVFIGPIPDHSVVVLACDESRITIYDPDSPNPQDSYPTSRFLDAWADSKNYMVISKKSKKL